MMLFAVSCLLQNIFSFCSSCCPAYLILSPNIFEFVLLDGVYGLDAPWFRSVWLTTYFMPRTSLELSKLSRADDLWELGRGLSAELFLMLLRFYFKNELLFYLSSAWARKLCRVICGFAPSDFWRLSKEDFLVSNIHVLFAIDVPKILDFSYKSKLYSIAVLISSPNDSFILYCGKSFEFMNEFEFTIIYL